MSRVFGGIMPGMSLPLFAHRRTAALPHCRTAALPHRRGDALPAARFTGGTRLRGATSRSD
jgi:hypothetical protein